MSYLMVKYLCSCAVVAFLITWFHLWENTELVVLCVAILLGSWVSGRESKD